MHAFAHDLVLRGSSHAFELGSYTFDALGPGMVRAAARWLRDAIAALARGTTLVEGHGYTDPANLSGELPLEQATLAQRTVLGWYIVNDPGSRTATRSHRGRAGG